MEREELIAAFMQGRLGIKDAAQFEERMKTDKALAAEVAMLRSVRGVMGEAEEPSTPKAWTRLSTAIDEARFKPANENRPMRLSPLQAACAVIAAVGLWQFTVVPNLVVREDGFVPASVTVQSHTLQVRFEPTASAGEISATLYELGGAISGGPSALGIYTISFASEDARGTAEQKLKLKAGLVAEILAP